MPHRSLPLPGPDPAPQPRVSDDGGTPVAAADVVEGQRRLDALGELRAMGEAGDFDEFVGRSSEYR